MNKVKKELQYMIIEYTKDDEKYIDEVCEYLENECDKILNFFEIKKLDEKVNIKLYNNINNFSKVYKFFSKKTRPSWLCGFSFEKDVYILSFMEYIKTQGHENDTIIDLKKLILHEFVHSIHYKVNNGYSMTWLSEGLATTFSNQYSFSDRKFSASIDEIKNGRCSYINFYTMFNYVLDNYSKDYIIKLLTDYEYALEETERLYDEVNKIYNDQNINSRRIV